MQPITKVQGSPEEGSYLSRSQIREQVTGTGAVIRGKSARAGEKPRADRSRLGEAWWPGAGREARRPQAEAGASGAGAWRRGKG